MLVFYFGFSETATVFEYGLPEQIMSRITPKVAVTNQTATATLVHRGIATRQQALQQFPPLETITRPNVDTAAAAFYFSRQQQTLRQWACFDGTGPIRPLRINGRLAWPVREIKRVLGVQQ